MDSLITKKDFLLAAMHGNLYTVLGYLAANKNPDDINTRVKYNPNFGISSSDKYSLKGLKGFLYKNFYYDDFNYYHDQSSWVRNNLTFHYNRFQSNVLAFERSYRHGMTALSLAAELGRTEVVGILLKVPGIDVNTCDSNDCTPLMLAAMYGHQEVVEALLKMPDINLTKRSRRRSSCFSAAELADLYGHKEIAAVIRAKILNDYTPMVIHSSYQARLDGIDTAIILPKHLTCPLGLRHKIMADPITVTGGTTFDRQSLKAYFNYLGNPETIHCPVTGSIIKITELDNETNPVFMQLIKSFVKLKEVEYGVVDIDARSKLRAFNREKHANNRHTFHQSKYSPPLEDLTASEDFDEDYDEESDSEYDTDASVLMV